jgi:4-aminobutyrate aminotransferase-like enzyme
MPFRRFFERGAKDAPPATAPAATDDEHSDEAAAVAGEEPEETGEAEAIPAEQDEAGWRDRAAAVLPTGASTGSKRVGALYGADDAVGPTHYVRAIGCRVTDADGYEYLDCTMALGAVSLGYAEPNVTRAVVDAIA